MLQREPVRQLGHGLGEGGGDGGGLLRPQARRHRRQTLRQRLQFLLVPRLGHGVGNKPDHPSVKLRILDGEVTHRNRHIDPLFS